MTRKEDIPTVEVVRELAPRIDGRVTIHLNQYVDNHVNWA